VRAWSAGARPQSASSSPRRWGWRPERWQWAVILVILGVVAVTTLLRTVILRPLPASTAQPTSPPTPGTTASSTYIGTRQEPVPFGEAYSFMQDGRVFDVTVIAVERRASAMVKAADPFNASAVAGEDYIVARLRLVLREGPSDRAFRIPLGNLRLYAEDRFWTAPASSVAPDPKLVGRDVLPGQTVEGWLPGKHLPDALIDEALLVWNGVFFALR
jgi:hypothetical protein